MKIWRISLATMVSVSLLAGCTPNITPEHYSTSSTQQVSVVRHGVVISSSQVKVSDSGSNWAGTLAGGGAGAVVGSTLGQGSGSLLLGIGGALLGGIAGNKAEEAISSQTATQYMVQLTGGSTVSVTQGGTVIPVGTKVLLLEGNPARLQVDTTTTPNSNASNS